MDAARFPNITTVVQAEPWEKGHWAIIKPLRPISNSNTAKQHKTIVVGKLPK